MHIFVINLLLKYYLHIKWATNMVFLVTKTELQIIQNLQINQMEHKDQWQWVFQTHILIQINIQIQ
jgi:hypothetical protein